MATRKTPNATARTTRTTKSAAKASSAKPKLAVSTPLAKRASQGGLARPRAPAPAVPERKPAKQRAKLVRDSFTMPADDFALVASLKARALSAQREAKKSELLRAGLHARSTPGRWWSRSSG